ncbi:thioredoxin fold domain-containing protein [Cedecea sp. P7760]|uniref:thioredoxin fold domain-containing protein n=1 Tax=Cedecea sp. P7760 TaxID=2726983 RepID=UPI0015A03E90|nr:thioredoxin fold domain-containing protein [Cedecea sp. P7760]NWC63954.1 thioredoxin fold domain-containing protein [Cedecea sp. P7760]
MNYLHRNGPFVAEIIGGLLRARRDVTKDVSGGEGAHFLSVSLSEPIFVLPVTEKPWFVMHGDGLYAQHAHDGLAPLYRGSDAAQLLDCITDLLTTVENKRSLRGGIIKYGYAIVAAWLTGVLLGLTGYAFYQLMEPDVRQLTTVHAPQVFHPVADPTRFMPADSSVRPVMPNLNNDTRADRLVEQQPKPLAAVAPADGWDLPQSVRAELPDKLHKAASRGLFTVPLSSGHARTIYVFADPACPNCQRMERHFETAAGAVNVVIFPVTIEGREASLKALTPVMTLPEAERPAAWKQLFAADAGIGVPGAVQAAPTVMDENKAETARGAIGVNEVAFRAYRLPGTPWTISDDGRYVPQGVLSSPAALMDFLNGGGHDGQ